jgi:hypothetical protein
VRRDSYRYLFIHPSGSELAQLVELIGPGKLKVIVDKTYSFAKISDALAYVESGRAKGKVGDKAGTGGLRCFGTANPSRIGPNKGAGGRAANLEGDPSERGGATSKLSLHFPALTFKNSAFV